MCVQCYLKLHRSLWHCHCGCLAFHQLLCISLSLPLFPSSIPHLCNSHFASLSSPPSNFLTFPLRCGCQEDEKPVFVSLPFASLGCSSPFYSTVFVPLTLLPGLTLSPPPYIKPRSTARNCSNKMLMVCKWISLSHSVAWKPVKYRS